MPPQEMIDYEENVDKLSKEELVKEYCRLYCLLAKWDVMTDSWMSSWVSKDMDVNSFRSTYYYLKEKMFIVEYRMASIFEHRTFPTHDNIIPLDYVESTIVLPEELLKIVEDNLY